MYVARYYAKKRRPRPCQYTEDEALHRRRLENGDGDDSRYHSESLTPLDNANGANTPIPGQNLGSRRSSARSISPLKRAKLSTPTPSQSSSGTSPSADSIDSPAFRRPSKTDRGTETPTRIVSASGAISSPVKKATATPTTAMTVEIPGWMKKVHEALKGKYSLDSFAIVQKPKPADQPSAPVEWRIKCLDCPGRVYTLGPGETLNNFEVHLKNRQHVEKRTAARAARGS